MRFLPNMRLPAQFALFWERVTLSRITKFYLLFSVLHCIVQVILQVQAFSSNAQAANFLWKLVVQGHAFDPGFAVMGPNDLRFCEEIPSSFSTKSCQVVWSANSTRNGTAVTSPQSYVALPSSASPSISSSSTETTPASSTLTVLPTSVTPTQQADIISTVTVTTFTTPATVVNSQPISSTVLTTAKSSSTAIVNDEHDDDDDDDDDDDENEEDDDDKKVRVVKVGDHHEEEEDEHDDKRSLYARNDLLGLLISAVEINGSTTVLVDGFGWKNQTISLSQRCLFTLNYPVETLNNTKREDITFILFQIWVLGMSIVALLNESVPHIITSLVTHVGATAWAAFQIVHTADFHRQFSRLTTEGACGVNLLPTYWKERADAEIPGLALNAVSLILSAFLSWRLIKSFGWQTFKRVGASRTINRVYMLVLMLSIAIQLSLFFIVASIGVWIDQLFNGAVGHLASLSSVYKGIMITVLLLLVPWLVLGWIAVRRELRVPMMIFLVLSFLYLCGWGAMFASTSFRWTFKLWRFFSLITSASVLLTLITFVIGIMCRMNFGKGLSRYLNAQEPLPDYQEEQEYEYDDEKVEFPSNRALPTFSAAFGKGDEVPVPSQMKFGPPRVGPRFTNPSVVPFEPQPPEPSLFTGTTYSKETYANSIVSPINSVAYYNGSQLSRQTSNGSQKSYSSFRSDGSAQSFKTHKSSGSVRSTASGGSTGSDRSRRWVIE